MSGAASVALIRPARVEDAEAIAALAAELRSHLGDPTHYLTAAAIRRDSFSERREFECLVAEAGGVVVGYAMFFEVYEPSYAARGFYLADLCVTARMRRRGIGRQLIDAVAATCRERGRTFVWWHTSPQNTEALQFYQGLGLEIIEPFIVHVRVLDWAERQQTTSN